MPGAYERWTRLLGRVGAVLLALSVLIPVLWRDADGHLHARWIWEGRRGSEFGEGPIFFLHDGF